MNEQQAFEWSRADKPHCEGCGAEITPAEARRHGHMCARCDSGRGFIAPSLQAIAEDEPEER